jgi:histone H3/H4
MAKEITITVVLDDERLREIFDNNDVKFSKAKVKRVKEVIDEIESDIQERLEESLEEFIEEIVQEEFGE